MNEELPEIIIGMVSILFTGISFFGVGIYAGKKKEPMWFWTGSTVPVWRVKDIPAYNRANARMWKMYSIPYLITGVTLLWFPVVSGVIVGIWGTGGVIVLIVIYQRIKKKYFRS